MLRNSEQTPFPATGKPDDAVLREIDQARANDWDWFSLKNPTASYPGLFIRVPDLVGGHGLNCGCGV